MKEEQATTKTSLPQQAQSVPDNSQSERRKLATNSIVRQDKTAPEPSRHSFLRFSSWSDNMGEKDLKLGLWLLLIIILVCLGSLPIIPSLIPITPLSISSSSLSSLHPTAGHSTLIGGRCNASSQELQAIPNPQTFLLPAQLPEAWRQSGYTQADYTQAQICAAAFIVAYYSFDSQKVATFTTCTSLLSSGGRQRFYTQGADRHAGPHAVSLQPDNEKRHLQQTAQPGIPYLIDAQYSHHILLAWMVIPYNITIRTPEKTSSSIVHATVLIIQQPGTLPSQKASWLVSDWHAGTSLFMAPAAL